MDKKNGAYEFESKTAEEAIKKGLEQLGLTKETAEIKIVDEGTSGLFGLMGSKPARVKIQPKTEKEKSSEIKRVPSSSKVFHGNNNELEKSLKEHMFMMLKLMHFTEEKPDIKISQSEAECLMEVEFKDNKLSSLLIGKNGKVLRAFEVVLQSMISKEFRKKQEFIPKISVDINKYTSKQKEKIKEDVDVAIQSIKETGKPYKLNPMAPQLRKFVHIMLQESPDYETISEGEDEQRRVVIRPKKS